MSSSRLPVKSDFPSSLHFDIVPPSNPSHLPVNVLILLHGLGDTQASFAQLGKNLNLPETVCISIRGPNPIPAIFTGNDGPAFHWGDDVLVDESRGDIDLDAGFTTSRKVLKEVLTEVLVSNCGYSTRNILFLGFGQGGMAALHLVSSLEQEFGGCISIGGRLPAGNSSGTKSKTPVLVCGGGRSSQVTKSAIEGLKAKFGEVEYVKWEKPNDSMPGNREEMLPIMKFLARRLRSRAGVPNGAVEV